jgi:hypothetical protein
MPLLLHDWLVVHTWHVVPLMPQEVVLEGTQAPVERRQLLPVHEPTAQAWLRQVAPAEAQLVHTAPPCPQAAACVPA